MTTLIVRAHMALLRALDPSPPPAEAPLRRRGDHGQTTAEYALVLLGAAGIALLLVAWATQSGAIGKLFDTVVNDVIGKVR
ncbi:DUF4244 domain-containing protein [Rhabdothermincola salaria]|uniref:DUF4244 domain-containing protein n=1 Tax=Rhabdothermincola salaria TaxID=2903142 RepID=UPI001E5311F6|nr:DUF4244 domain-containing protein [Rhabdothermincola salaria]MCD9624628.1 DUF4244 domain-containing protein [Rhabdothermincola salaria]